MSTLILFAVAFVALLPLLVRDLKRADERRRRREFARTDPFQRIARNFEAMSLAMGAALLPTMTRAAIEMQRTMRQVEDAMKPNLEAFERLARDLSRKGDNR